MSKYLFNHLQIDVNQIKCVFLALIPKYFSKLKIRPPKAINHGLRYRLSATTAPQDLPTGFILPPEHFVSNHQRYKSWCNGECLDLVDDHDSPPWQHFHRRPLCHTRGILQSPNLFANWCQFITVFSGQRNNKLWATSRDYALHWPPPHPMTKGWGTSSLAFFTSLPPSHTRTLIHITFYR